MRKWLPLILIVAALIRLYNLSDPPLFFDESIHATILKSLFSGSYHYDPAYHGPLLYYLLYVPVSLLGESEFSLRILPALVGVAVSLIPLLYRRYIGDHAAIISAALVAISAIVVNYSRFCRADIFQLLFTALFAYLIFRYLESEKNWRDVKPDKDTVYLVAAFVCMALFATLKETFYPFAAIFLIFFIFDIKRFRIGDLLLSVAIFFLIYAALYTNFFTYMDPLTKVSEFPAVKAVSYWKHQHDIARIAGPWYYYLELLLLYDLPTLMLAVFGLFAVVRGRRGEFVSFMTFWFVASLMFFSYMQEKVPWLAVHILFPMYVVAGVGIGEIYSRVDKRIGAACIVACLLFSAYGSVAANIVNPVNPAEPALYLPTQYDVREFAEKTKNDTIYIFTNVGEYWPLAWYLRDHDAIYITTGIRYSFGSGDYVVVNATNDAIIDKSNLIFDEIMVVRCWTWWTTPDISRILEFLVWRKPMTDVSCMNFTVYIVK